MDLSIFEVDGHVIAEIASNDRIETTQDAFDLMASAYYQGADHLLLREEQLMPKFFDLKTGVAGEILQKFSNYQMGLTVTGAFERLESESFQAFMAECNRGKQVAFVADRHAALDKITSQVS